MNNAYCKNVMMVTLFFFWTFFFEICVVLLNLWYEQFIIIVYAAVRVIYSEKCRRINGHHYSIYPHYRPHTLQNENIKLFYKFQDNV
jgi:hypothetical protein